jgi:hypothetical protein
MQRLRSFLRNYKISVPTIGAAVVGLAWLAFGYFGVHTLFIDEEVSEALPTFDVAPTAAEPVAVQAGDGPAQSGTATESDAATGPAPVPSTVVAPAGDETAAAESESVAEAPSEAAAPTPTPTPTPTPEIVTEYSGAFESDAHPTAGRAVVLGNGTGQRFLRFEDFETDNGPDLNVYLVNSSTGDVSDFVDLGDLKGNIGEQNYEIPAGVDLDVYDQVVIWCVRFDVGFGGASLMAV